jgi:hypothetical protein
VCDILIKNKGPEARFFKAVFCLIVASFLFPTIKKKGDPDSCVGSDNSFGGTNISLHTGATAPYLIDTLRYLDDCDAASFFAFGVVPSGQTAFRFRIPAPPTSRHEPAIQHGAPRGTC